MPPDVALAAPIAPRLWTLGQVARFLALTPQSFATRRAALEAAGLPPPLWGEKSGQRWDSAAIEAWLDRWSGLTGEHRAAAEIAEAGDLAAHLKARATAVANGTANPTHGDHP